MKWSMKWPYSIQWNPKKNVLFQTHLLLWPYVVSCGALLTLECIPGGCIPPTCCPYLPAWTAPGGGTFPRGVYLPGGCTCQGGTCPGGVPARGCTCVPAQRGVYLPRGCTCPGTPPCEQNDWQTGVKLCKLRKLRLWAVLRWCWSIWKSPITAHPTLSSNGIYITVCWLGSPFPVCLLLHVTQPYVCHDSTATTRIWLVRSSILS